MKLLSIDSSTPCLSVALLQNQDISAQIEVEHHPPAPNPLLSMVDQVLSSTQLALSELDGYVLTLGPGSFTGLRVGLSLVKGFVLATEKPVMGISSLDAWALRVKPSGKPVCSLLDARKGEVYYAVFQKSGEGLASLIPEQTVPPEDIVSNITQPTEFIGTGLIPYRVLLQDRLGSLFVEATLEPQITTAGAAVLACAPRFAKERSFDLEQLNLRYLRRSEAEVRQGKP